MRIYENKDELKNEINKSFAKYISEFNDIPEPLKDKRIDEVDRTPAENLAYQVGWTTLILKWEADERKGLQVKTPSYHKRVVFIDRSPAECYNSFRVLWIGEKSLP